MDRPVFFYDVVQAVRAAIAAADPEKRKALATAIDCFSNDEPSAFYWAIGPQAPVFLRDLLFAISYGSTEESKPRDNVFRLVRD